jgi:uncharacterized protein (TIGR00255 family)
MTAFAQIKGQVPTSTTGQRTEFTVSLKSVNHRFLDVHMRMPAESDALEMKVRKLLKEHIARGHVEYTLSFGGGSGGSEAVSLNRALVAGYVEAFRTAAKELGVKSDPDLNAALRLPGALGSMSVAWNDETEAAVLDSSRNAITKLNDMREHEGRSIETELRDRMGRLRSAVEEIGRLRGAVQKAHFEKIQSRMNEMLNSKIEPERLLQEAALLSERSDIQEEIVRMTTHIEHLLGLVGGGEVGKKIDFLLQEMNREANTLLSKTSGVVGEALRLTELGLAMKSEIEKAREQAQNIE